jgi:hypothetical protein
MFGGAGAGMWNPAAVAGGFGAPLQIASATPRNAISRTLGFAERPSGLVIRSDDQAAFGSATVVQPTRFDLSLKAPILDVKAMALRSVTMRNLIPNVPSYQTYFYYSINGLNYVFKYGAFTTGTLPIVKTLADFMIFLNESAQYVVQVPPGVRVNDTWYNANVSLVTSLSPLYPAILTFGVYGTSGRIGAQLNNAVGAPGDVCVIGGLDVVPFIFSPQANVRADLTLDSLLGVPATPSPPVTFTRASGASVFIEPANIAGTQSLYVTVNITSSAFATASNTTQPIVGYFPVSSIPKGDVIAYQAAFPHWVWQVSPAVQEIIVTLLDENLQPFDLPVNALVEIELALLYSDSSL